MIDYQTLDNTIDYRNYDTTHYHEYNNTFDYLEEWEDDGDLWANLYERDDRGDVYELVGSLRDRNG